MSRIHRGILTLLHVFIFLLGAVPCRSQSKFLIQHYTNENGLPANGIKAIELDKKNGFVWIGTQAGLVRFDGKHFTNFSSSKTTVASSRITFVARNREGTIYCEDDNFSVYRVTHNKPEFVMYDTFLLHPFAVSKGSSQLPQRQMAEKLKRLPRSTFLPNGMLFDDDLGDSSSFTFLFADRPCHYNAAKDTLLLFNEEFRQILKVDGYTYFVREDLDIWTYDDSLLTIAPVNVQGMPHWNKNGNEKPQLVWQPGMKDPLIIYKRDIWKVHRKGHSLSLEPFCNDCCPDDGYIYSAQLWEEQKMVFLGSEKNGLYVIRRPFLETIRSDTFVEAARAEYGQAEITPGMITTGYGLSFSASNKLFYRKGGMQFQPFSIYRDRYGDHWFHARDTINHLHRKDGRITKMVIGSGIVKMIFAETNNRLYVATDSVIAEITGDRFRQLCNLSNSPGERSSFMNPDDMIEWKPGVLLIATEKLLLFDTEIGKISDTIPIPGCTAKVRTLLKYGEYLLIGTYGQGFYIYKNGVVKKMPLDKNGYLSYVHCFIPDNHGFCWISTNHGLFKLSLTALVAAYEKNLHEIYYHYFGQDDGMYNTELNGGCQPCALRMSSGLFSFPSMNGVVLVDPAKQHPPPPAGKVFIEKILADSVTYAPDDPSLEALPHHFRDLRFQLAIPLFDNLENIYFSYKLEPYNNDWQTHDILQNNTLQFGGLPPGNYTLYVRVRNGFEPDQFGTSKIRFRILPAWYQTWWFFVLCLLGFLAMTWALVNWRTARIASRKEELQLQVTAQTKQLENQLQQLQRQQLKLEDDNKIKARLIGIISHDMITPIRFMAFLSKKLRNAFSPGDPSYETAEAFVNVSQELESLSVNMLNWIRFHHDAHDIRPEQFNLQHLVEESTEIVAILAREKGVQLHNEIPENSSFIQYRQAIGIVVYNLAMNAMKYTEAGNIVIMGRFTGSTFTMVITDTGIGMAPEMVNQLNGPEPVITEHATGDVKKFQFGYLIIKDLLQLTQGDMIVESELHKGTKVTIRLPSL